MESTSQSDAAEGKVTVADLENWIVMFTRSLCSSGYHRHDELGGLGGPVGDPAEFPVPGIKALDLLRR
jgi:hypothetical protein